VQIYYCASLDALIGTALLGVIFFFGHHKDGLSVVGSAICLFVASFLSFGATFILPVLVVYAAVRGAHLGRAVVVIGIVAVAYFALFHTLGFNYVQAFATASGLENPGGFRLACQPLPYLFTRLEDVGEILVFLGPYLLAFTVHGLRHMRRDWRNSDSFVLSASAYATILIMFVSGAFRKGETARACLFIYPYFTLCVADYLSARDIGLRDKNVLLALTFGQTVLMQTVGNYFW
jgi:hypothetical protein